MNFYLVDDDPDVLALIRRVLEQAGHRVEARGSSLQALEEIPVLRPECVITDVMMPEMDGFELTRELRRRPELASMKIIVLSAKTYDFDRRRAKELGADGYITKPIQLPALLRSIEDILSHEVVIGYWGVHGTLPAPGLAYVRYGGNTSCVSLEVGGEPLFVFDCGSGIKRLSDHVMSTGAGQRFSARIFISHTHWDHINTVPFFAPLYLRGNQIEIFGPYQGDLTIERAISAQMESVYFPVTVREFGARLLFRDLREETLEFGPVRIDTMLLRHPGYCLGYRITSRGRRICYITDNELYLASDARYDLRYVEQLANFVRGADLLITDTTYRDHEYPSKVDWGHSSVSQVADLAARAEVKRLHLFHHDPDQTDEHIDLKLEETRAQLKKLGSAVVCEAPAEGSKLVL
ncbi:MAG: response regulator [Betaproteobacteria bacterium]|nr:response regulator [Betaproteobacteria bacterium]